MSGSVQTEGRTGLKELEERGLGFAKILMKQSTAYLIVKGEYINLLSQDNREMNCVFVFIHQQTTSQIQQSCSMVGVILPEGSLYSSTDNPECEGGRKASKTCIFM